MSYEGKLGKATGRPVTKADLMSEDQNEGLLLFWGQTNQLSTGN